MPNQRNVALVVIMALALTLGAAQIVTSIGQVAYAQKVGQNNPSLAESGIPTGLITSPLPPGLITSPLPPG